MSIDWSRFCDVIESHESFLLTSHIRPDCDALGSELGMAGILEALGKKVIIVNGQKTPDSLAFIDPTNRIQTIGETITIEELADIDAMMVLDTSAWAQLGPMGDVLKSLDCKKIVFDHHKSADDLDAEEFKDTTAEAAGRLVAEAAEHLKVKLTPEIATPLFAAIATDTGWFRFGSAKEGTYQWGSKLIAAGARPAEIYGELYEQDTIGRMRLRGLVLSRIDTKANGRLAYTYINAEDFAATGANPTDTEDLVNLLLEIRGTEAAVIFVGQLSGGYKLSFRSRCQLDCSKTAEKFGGGGHKAAAGAFIEGELDEIIPRVLDVVVAGMG